MARLQGQMASVDERAFAQNRCPFEDVAKLSNVTRPVILKKCVLRVTGQTRRRPAKRPADFLQK